MGDLRDNLFLVSNGIPFDVAFSLPAEERRAWVIVLGELSGMIFSHASGDWVW